MNLRYFAWREVGRPTHDYWYEGNIYYRRSLAGGPVEQWNGSNWTVVVADAVCA